MSVKLKLLPKPKSEDPNADLFESNPDGTPKTIECPPNMPGLFRYAEAIVRSDIKEGRGQGFVLELLALGQKSYEAIQKLRSKEDNGR